VQQCHCLPQLGQCLLALLAVAQMSINNSLFLRGKLLVEKC
jgi:hypothetical protein